MGLKRVANNNNTFKNTKHVKILIRGRNWEYIKEIISKKR